MQFVVVVPIFYNITLCKVESHVFKLLVIIEYQYRYLKFTYTKCLNCCITPICNIRILGFLSVPTLGRGRTTVTALVLQESGILILQNLLSPVTRRTGFRQYYQIYRCCNLWLRLYGYTGLLLNSWMRMCINV